MFRPYLLPNFSVMKPKDRNTPLTPFEKRSRRKRRLLRTLIVIVGILVILRIAAPVIALKVINDKLSGLPEYICHIDDLDISIIEASVTLQGIEMKKKNGKVKVPFFKCNRVHVHLASFRRRAVNIKVGKCEVNLVKGKTKADSQMSIDKEWIKLAKEMPFKPNDLSVRSAEVHYYEFYRNPDIHLAMTEIHLKVKNLKNLEEITDKLPATATLTALVEGAKLDISVEMDAEKIGRAHV